MLIKQAVGADILDISTLEVGYDYTKKAYLLNSTFKYDKNGDPYFTFNFKDCNKVRIQGRQFRVVDATNKSIDIVSWNHEVVITNFTVSVWNNELNLVVHEIRKVDADDNSFSVFMNKVEGLDKYTERLEKGIISFIDNKEYTIPFQFSTTKLDNVCNGELGGYIKLLVGAYNHLVSFNGINGVDMNKLMELFVRVQKPYFSYLELKDKSESIAAIHVLEIIFNHRSPDENDMYNDLMSDCVLALCGIAKPTHVYSYLVYSAISGYLFDMNVAYNIPLMAKGFSHREGDLLLTNY